MTRNLLRALSVVFAVTGLGAVGHAQTVSDPIWDPICWPPDNDTPYSNDYLTYILSNSLFGVTVGISGSVAYGAQCWPNDGGTNEIRGGIGFSIGDLGSVQDNDLATSYPSRFPVVDDNLRLTFGMPLSPGGSWGYAGFVDPAGARSIFGSAGMELAFVGASNRYLIAQTVQDGMRVKLQADLAGDAARLAWTLQSTDATPRSRALWFGQWVTFLSKELGAPEVNYMSVPGSRPIRTDTRWIRATDPNRFPNVAEFAMSQEFAYGLQVLNGPTAATTDGSGFNSDQSEAIEFVVADAGWLLGEGNNIFTNARTFLDTIFPDTFIGLYGYIQKFPQFIVPANTQPFSTLQPQAVTYYKSTTGVSNYALPYAVVVDTPKIIQVEPTNPTQAITHVRRVTAAGIEQYYNFRVYVDNVGGFGKVDREIPLEGVKVTLSLPNGFYEFKSPNQGEDDRPRVITRFIDRIEATAVGFVDFKVAVDPTAVGFVTYQVKVDPGTTIVSKTLTGTVNVAARPYLKLRGENGGITGANLVSPAWTFASTSWENILSYTDTLGTLVPWRLDQDFRAYTFDANIQRYIPQSGPERSKGSWIIAKNDRPTQIALSGSPQQPTDMTPAQGGAPLITLRSGWNLIGNPYNYSFPLGQTVGVSGSIGTTANTFAELVDQGVVSGAIAYWDQDNQTYKYIDYTQDVLPNYGYWIYVYTAEDLTLSFPPVFQPFIFGADSAAGIRRKSNWVQSPNKWRLQLAARTAKGRDEDNFVGVVPTTKEVRKYQIAEPPAAPVEGAVSVAVKGTANGKDQKLASAFSEKAGRNAWTFDVNTNSAGAVTVTWPNLSTLPKNLKFRLVDLATGASRDMRRNSGYTFTAAEANVARSFKVEVEPGSVSSTKIGSVVVSGENGRGPSSSVTVQYSLTGAANTTVRILAADGREVYVATRGRADRAGLNSVTWAKRDGGNRAVPPGTYRAEIVAETESGERVRRLVPIIVTR